MSNQLKLNFPDDLLFMRDYADGQIPISQQNESRYSKYWEFLINALAKKISSTIELKREEIKEEAINFIANEICRAKSLENITAMGLLIRNFKKYLAKKNSPVQYELDGILRNALRELEKDKLIIRESGEKDNNICGNTRFALPTVTAPESETANLSDYETRRNGIPQYTVKVIAGDWEKTKIIPPSIARKLILHLLKAFDGWTRERDLLKAINNHIPEQLEIVSPEIITPKEEEEGHNNSPIIADEDSKFFIYEHDIEHSSFNANGLSRVIWDDICQISEKSFCLYFLPVTLYCRKDINQSTAGDPRRVSEHCKKISGIFLSRLKHFKELSPDYKTKIEITKVLKNIHSNLSGKCKEKGYSPHLYSNESVD